MSEPSPSDVTSFVQAVARQLGLRVADRDAARMVTLLASRMRATRSRTASEYLELLSSRRDEEAALAGELAINETYFLRNRPQFAAFASLVAERARQGVRHLRVLSAACSSGEEPYSIAMVIREVIEDLAPWTITIVGFDLDPDAVEKARRGRYTSWSLREVDSERGRRHFHLSGGEHTVDDAIRKMVTIEQRNLVRPDPSFWRAESFDVVFCRNVLMYFDPPAARQVVAQLSAALAPGGHLFLGHAETLRGLSNDFVLCHTHETFYYRHQPGRDEPLPAAAPVDSKPPPANRDADADAAPCSAHDDFGWMERIARSSRRIEDLSRPPSDPPSAARPHAAAREFAGTLELFRSERFPDALEALATERAIDGEDPDADLLQAVILLHMGQVAAASDLGQRILATNELSASAHYVMALCCERSGDLEGALEHDRKAIYLDPDFAMPHLHVGLLTRRRGHEEEARRAMSLARSLLAHEDAARITMFGGGFGREALMGICQGEIRSFGGRDG